MRPTLFAALLSGLVPAGAQAAEFTVAVVAPQSGNFQILGDQIRLGATLAAGSDVAIVSVDETCEENSGKAVAEAIRKSGAKAAIGFLCTETLEGALPALAASKIAAITLSVRSPVIMEDALKHQWPLFRMAPTGAEEREAIIGAIFSAWKDRPFALVDDGTIFSRDTVETVREALEQKGMKPTLIDNFRPAQEVQTQFLRRLAKAGVTHVFAAADRGDLAVMARDAKAAKLDLTFLGGDAVNGADQPVPLTPGVWAVTVPEWQTLEPAALAVSELAGKGKAAEGYVLPAHAAVSLLRDAEEIAGASGASLGEAMIDTPFSTALGDVHFGRDHEMAGNPFRLLEWNGTAFVEPSVTQ
jgi:branched-chain amino acid transport system substrate-binding protein